MIDSCKILTLDGFISCLCEQNYAVLGEGSIDEQLIAWQKIYAEYVTLMEDAVLIQAHALRTDITYWQLQYKAITAAVDISKKWRDKDIIDMLRKKGHDLEFSETNVDAYRKDLDRVITRSGYILTNIANIEHELKTLSQEMGEDDKPLTRIDMMVNIMQFGKFMGFNIDTKTATVEAYAAIRNLYYKQLKELQQ